MTKKNRGRRARRNARLKAQKNTQQCKQGVSVQEFEEEKIIPGYYPEAQAIIVYDAQIQGRLTERTVTFRIGKIETNEGLDWFILNESSNYLVNNCNIEALGQLSKGDILKEIFDPVRRNDFSFRPASIPIAALFKDETVLYKSPGFDLGLHKSSDKER